LMVILYNLVTFVASVIFVEQNNSTGKSLTIPIFWLTTALLVIQVLFLSIGLFLGAMARNAAKASGLATLIILGTFMLKVLIDLKKDLDFLRFLTPFRYFNSADVMFDHKIDLAYLVLCLGVSAAAVAGTYYFFQKRDLRC
jgi:ABC-2 type transport system permease protein